MGWTFSVFASQNPVEVALAPWPPIFGEIKYGSTSKLDASVGYFIDQNFELQLATVAGIKLQSSSESLLGIYGGLLYNFSEEHVRSYVVGAGLGYVNHYPLVVYSPDDPSSDFYYVRFGKRFLLSESYQITYFPYVDFIYGSNSGDRHFGGQINVFNFSILF